MKIAIEGCCHGEIDTIYNSLINIEKVTGEKIDLLICCGDYEALRNQNDLKSLAVKPKYRTMGSFYKYYSGKVKAPILTLVIGGNHESSNHFSEINNGGWLCENIFFMGRSNVVTFGGIRIGGLSGIFKEYDYQKGYFETKPFSEDHLRSIYHIRELDVFKIMQISSPPRLDIMFSHDWPMGIIDYGNRNNLLRFKKGLIQDVESGKLGNPATMEVLKHLKPKFWFSAHLHVKFAAIYKHDDNDYNDDNENVIDENKSTEKTTTTTTTTTTDETTTNTTNENKDKGEDKGQDKENTTRFLALDKVLPNRDFLQVLNFKEKIPTGSPLKLCYDPQWLLIQAKTKHITDNYTNSFKTPLNPELFLNLFTDKDIENVESKLMEIYKLKYPENKEPTIQDALEIRKDNFVKNTYCHDPDNHSVLTFLPPAFDNPQDKVYNNLIKIISQLNTIEITNETLKELDVSTFSGNLEELQKEQLINNQKPQRSGNQPHHQQQSQEPQYKDDSEIILDD